MTPVKNGRIDDEAFVFLCERQIERGTAALVPLGIYSEAAAFDRKEQARAITLAVEVSRGRVPVIAGSGINYTSIAVDLAQQAEALGADGLLSAVPYYDQSSQDGLFRHFQAIQAAVNIPLIIYDVPSHTGVTLAADTILRLAELPKIAGIADATGNVARAMVLHQYLGPDFLLLCGGVREIEIFLGLGGQGHISILTNIAPAIEAAMYCAWTEKKLERFHHLAALLELLESALCIGDGPVALKWALASLGLMEGERHLPPTWLTGYQETLLRLALDTVVPVEAALTSGNRFSERLPPFPSLKHRGDRADEFAENRPLLNLEIQEKTTKVNMQNLISKTAFQVFKDINTKTATNT
jgi:4-hydroxy-tetrahydrodipicolinate synthase